MFDIAIIVIDIIFSILLLISGRVIINYVSKKCNLKLSLFKFEEIQTKKKGSKNG